MINNMEESVPYQGAAERRILRNLEISGIADRRVPKGVNAISSLTEMIKNETSLMSYASWRAQHITTSFLEALRMMTITQPQEMLSSDASVQYGVTQGLALALNLLSDPASVLPSCFTEREKTEDEKRQESEQEKTELVSDYLTPPM